MLAPRTALVTLLLTAALALQLSVLSRLGLPGATPDVVLVVVAALALAYGPLTGSAVGFAAGLALDVVPPSEHAIGRYAFVLCVVGYLLGSLRSEVDRSTVLPILAVGLAAVVATLLYAGMGALFGDTAVTGARLLGLLPSAVLYDMFLAPFVLPAVTALVEWAEPEPSRW
ncbi:MAG: rod shape-determining protein MreD [Carbonactinosporaceae bacterium]